MEEIWKDIKGYENLYKVSNLGSVKSFINDKHGKILKAHLTHDGYLIIGLHKNSITKNFKVHRLVAETFIPNPDNLLEVNHKDKNKLNNAVNNLEWCTRKYNCLYSYNEIYKVPKKKYTRHKKYKIYGGLYIYD